MSHRLGVLFAIVVLAATAAPSTAQQPLVYEFADEAGVAASSFTVTEGQTIRLRVYLRERNAQGTVLTGDGGLLTAAVRVTYGAASAATVANPATDIAPAVPPWADGNTSGADASSGVVNVNSSFTQGVMPTDGRVLLGTFTFTGHRAGSVDLAAIDRNLSSNFDTTSFTNANALDTMIDPGAATLTVVPVPVPEPAAVLAVGAAGLGALGAARRARSRAR